MGKLVWLLVLNKEIQETPVEKSVQQPEESIFSRTIGRILGTLNYLSCTFGPLGNLEKDTVTGEEVLKSISTFNVNANWHKGCEYFGDNNMLDCFPKEMLSHVASFLPPKDFNSLVRTNKTSHSRLNNRDRQRLHIELDFRYTYVLTYDSDDEETALVVINADVVLLTEKDYKVFGFALQGPNKSTGTKEEQLAALSNWYYTMSCGAYPDARLICLCDIREMLSRHLQYFFHQNVFIERLKLTGAKEREVVDMTKLLKENRMRVNEIELDMDIVCAHDMDLIRVCRPNSLIVKNALVPPTFHDDHVIRQLTKLNIDSELVEMKEGDLSVYYSASSLVMWNMEGATAQDMELFIKQWTLSTKTYHSLDLNICVEEVESTWKKMLARLDSRVVEVKPIDGDLDGETWFCLRRIADDSELYFGYSMDGLKCDEAFLSDFDHSSYDSN